MIGASVAVGATWLVPVGGGAAELAEDAEVEDSVLEAELLVGAGAVEPDRLSVALADEAPLVDGLPPVGEDPLAGGAPLDELAVGVLEGVPVGAEVQAASSIVTATASVTPAAAGARRARIGWR